MLEVQHAFERHLPRRGGHALDLDWSWLVELGLELMGAAARAPLRLAGGMAARHAALRKSAG
jgi:hypothetical protein